MAVMLCCDVEAHHPGCSCTAISAHCSIHTWESSLAKYAIIFAHDFLVEQAQCCAENVPVAANTATKITT
jgi:hypothetical protein